MADPPPDQVGPPAPPAVPAPAVPAAPAAPAAGAGGGQPADLLANLPLRLADPEVGDPELPDIIWEVDTGRMTEMERYLKERDWLSLMVQSADARGRLLARNAVARRLLSTTVPDSLQKFGEQTLAHKTMQENISSDQDGDIVPLPTFGNVDVVSAQMRKDFLASFGQEKLTSVSDPGAYETARLLFSTARSIINANRLTVRAAFDLINSRFKGSLAENFRQYASTGRYGPFAHMVQTMTNPISSGNALSRKLQTLLHTRPETQKLGDITSEIIALNRRLAALAPARERASVFESGGRQAIDTYVMMWFPSALTDIRDRYREAESAHQTRLATLEAAGRIEDLRRAGEEFDSVATLAEAFLFNVRHLEPCGTVNLVGEGPQAGQKPARQAHAAEVEPQQQGVESSPQFQQLQQQVQQILHLQQTQAQHAQQQQQQVQQTPSYQSFPATTSTQAQQAQGGVQQQQEQIYDDPEDGAFVRRLEIMAFGQNPYQRQNTQRGRGISAEKLQHMRFQPPPPKTGLPQGPNERCVLCRAHLARDANGIEQQCWRYPDVETPTSAACPNCPNCFHPVALCRKGIPLTDLYVGSGQDDPRADRVPNASWPHANQAPEQKRN